MSTDEFTSGAKCRSQKISRWPGDLQSSLARHGPEKETEVSSVGLNRPRSKYSHKEQLSGIERRHRARYVHITTNRIHGTAQETPAARDAMFLLDRWALVPGAADEFFVCSRRATTDFSFIFHYTVKNKFL